MPPSACVELVDEHGVREDAVTLVGAATVSLREDARHAISMETSPSSADIARITRHDDGTIEVEIVRRGAFKDAPGGDRLELAPTAAVALWLEAVNKAIRVHSEHADLQHVREAHILSAVIRPRTRDEELAAGADELRAWAEASIARNMPRVLAQSAELRRAGLIDDQGNILVDLPADMQPGSRSDV
ncbi:MAG TPA: hypothetical protein VHE35_15040 [Kofleriaceae bacterium]|nr:hypothetical protein [Kofleriaceae bacterium]